MTDSHEMSCTPDLHAVLAQSGGNGGGVVGEGGGGGGMRHVVIGSPVASSGGDGQPHTEANPEGMTYTLIPELA